jgi:serine/threonine protein kinase
MNKASHNIGPYQIITRLGAGAFAEVYKAKDTLQNRDVAIKLGRVESVTTTELSIMRQLQDLRGFPSVYDSKVAQGQRYIAMQLLGKSSYELYKLANKRLSDALVIDIVTQGVDRLEAMHRRSFIHRDVKPQHLIYDTDFSLIYLTDFGLSNLKSSSLRLYSDNKTMHFVGTARFSGVNTHITSNHTAADDLESMIYIALYFVKGSLPWDASLGSKEQLIKCREVKCTYLAKGCPGAPEVLRDILSYLRSHKGTCRPNYDFIKMKLSQLKTLELLVRPIHSCALLPKTRKKYRKNRSTSRSRGAQTSNKSRSRGAKESVKKPLSTRQCKMVLSLSAIQPIGSSTKDEDDSMTDLHMTLQIERPQMNQQVWVELEGQRSRCHVF